MSDVTSLSGIRYTNWNCDVDGDTPPPVIFNRKTTNHNAIAWAWGEVDWLRHLCIMTLDSGDERDALTMIGEFQAHLTSVALVLEEIAVRTRKDGQP